MSKNKMPQLDEFDIDKEMSLPKRIAAYLNWAALIVPTRPISFQQLTKVCLILGRLPTENDKRVETVKQAVKRAKPILMERYQRGLVPHPGFGVRATVDSDDVARTQFENDTKRVVNAIRAVDRTRSIIRPSEIKDKDVRARVNSVNGVLKVLVSPELFNKLLPEKSE